MGDADEVGRKRPRKEGLSVDDTTLEDRGPCPRISASFSSVKEQANFGLSGLLAANDDSGGLEDKALGTKIKWSEPADAATPPMNSSTQWRLYVFDSPSGTSVSENSNTTTVVQLRGQSAFLFGRDNKVADVCVRHASVSKQHAVVQFRFKCKGEKAYVRPYILDVESSNGTFLNGQAVEPSRYVELLDKDVLRFGESSQEFVVMKAKLASEQK